jgi:hypothetical protein
MKSQKPRGCTLSVKDEKTFLFRAGVKKRYIQNRRTALYSKGKKFTNLTVMSAKPNISAYCIRGFHIRGTGDMLAIFIRTCLLSELEKV